MATGKLPWALSDRDWRDAHATFEAWARTDYDLAWFLGVEVLGLRDMITAPLVVDLDDLEDRKIAARETSNSVRSRRAVALVRLNQRRWRALQRQVMSIAEVVTVCSEIDRARLGRPNVAIVPNGYPAPPRPLGRGEVGEPPTLLLVGLFTYEPNIDAAFYLVREILPKLRSLVPDVQVRLVGDHKGELAPLADTPGVTVTGFVPDIDVELARADAMVVPLRFGSGTRIKILEAFAHRLPVIATPAAYEGLDVEPGTHLAAGQTADEFAEACRDVLVQPDLRLRLADAAEELYRRCYTTDAVVAAVKTIAARVGGGS
jgi:glycosyltransferase involved in cell wall biosynthesis